MAEDVLPHLELPERLTPGLILRAGAKWVLRGGAVAAEIHGVPGAEAVVDAIIHAVDP
jgi:hypothetical protein